MNNPFLKYATGQWREEEQRPGFTRGLLNSAGQGVENTFDAVQATSATVIGANDQVEALANETRGRELEANMFLSDLQRRTAERQQRGEDWWGGAIYDVAATALSNKEGSLQMIAEQLPNSGVVLASMATGAKAGALGGSAFGPAGTVVGTVAGGLVGMFAGNSLIETGNIAMEKGRDGFTDEERTESLQQGATKSAVITAIDAATLGVNRLVGGTVGRSVEKAIRDTLSEGGVDVASEAAVKAAMQVPEFRTRVVDAGKAAFESTTGRKASVGRGATEFALETVGEGAGEYLGSAAAGLETSFADAALESLLSVPQSLVEMGISNSGSTTPGALSQSVGLPELSTQGFGLLQTQARQAAADRGEDALGQAVAGSGALAGDVDRVRNRFNLGDAPQPTDAPTPDNPLTSGAGPTGARGGVSLDDAPQPTDAPTAENPRITEEEPEPEAAPGPTIARTETEPGVDYSRYEEPILGPDGTRRRLPLRGERRAPEPAPGEEYRLVEGEVVGPESRDVSVPPPRRARPQPTGPAALEDAGIDFYQGQAPEEQPALVDLRSQRPQLPPGTGTDGYVGRDGVVYDTPLSDEAPVEPRQPAEGGLRETTSDRLRRLQAARRLASEMQARDDVPPAALPPGTGTDGYVGRDGVVYDQPLSDEPRVRRSELLRARGANPVETRLDRESQDATASLVPEGSEFRMVIEELAAAEAALEQPIRDEIEATYTALTEEVRPKLESFLTPNWTTPPNLQQDDILTFISKAGGLDRDEAIASGIDPGMLKRLPVGKRAPFKKSLRNGGTSADVDKVKSIDGLVEVLIEAGYQFDESSTPETQVVDLVNTALDAWSDNSLSRDVVFWDLSSRAQEREALQRQAEDMENAIEQLERQLQRPITVDDLAYLESQMGDPDYGQTTEAADVTAGSDLERSELRGLGSDQLGGAPRVAGVPEASGPSDGAPQSNLQAEPAEEVATAAAPTIERGRSPLSGQDAESVLSALERSAKARGYTVERPTEVRFNSGAEGSIRDSSGKIVGGFQLMNQGAGRDVFLAVRKGYDRGFASTVDGAVDWFAGPQEPQSVASPTPAAAPQPTVTWQSRRAGEDAAWMEDGELRPINSATVITQAGQYQIARYRSDGATYFGLFDGEQFVDEFDSMDEAKAAATARGPVQAPPQQAAVSPAPREASAAVERDMAEAGAFDMAAFDEEFNATDDPDTVSLDDVDSESLGYEPDYDSVEDRRRGYNNPNQGDLFSQLRPQEDPYGKISARPGTRDQQRAEGRSALRDLFRSINSRLRAERRNRGEDGGPDAELLGSAMYKGFRDSGTNRLVGQEVKSPADLATLAQVYRDPRFETFRAIYVNDAGVVVGEEALSTRLPSSVMFEVGTHDDLAKRAGQYGATGIYLMHNHPSGSSEPSSADIRLTETWGQAMGGLMRSHIVIDNNEYTVIDRNGSYQTVTDEALGSIDFRSNPELPHEALGVQIKGPADVASLAKRLNHPDKAVVIMTDIRGRVQLVSSLPMDAFRRLEGETGSKSNIEMLAAVRRMARASGSGGFAFAILPENVDGSAVRPRAMGRIFADVMTADGQSVLGSYGGTSLFDGLMQTYRNGQETKKTVGVREDATPYDRDAPPEVEGPPVFGRPNGFRPTVETMTDFALRKFQDKFTPLKRAQQQVEQERGRALDESEDAYMAETLFHGKTGEDLRQIQERIVKPLVNMMKNFGIEQSELDTYLIAKHAEERNAKIREIDPQNDAGSGMTDAEAAKIIMDIQKSGRLPQFEQLGSQVYQMTQLTRDLLRASGLQEDALTDSWEASYKYYVPLRGYADNELATGGRASGAIPRTGKGFDIRGKESRRALGRRSLSGSPTMYAIQDLTEKTIRYRKNEVGQAFLKMVENNPDPTRWQIYTEDNPDMTRQFRNDRVIMAPANMAQSSEYFAVKRGGKTYYVKMADERLRNAMQNVGPETQGFLVKASGVMTRWLSTVNTSLDPEFVISNFTRDLQTALISLSSEQTMEGGMLDGEGIKAAVLKDIFPAIKAIAQTEASGNTKSDNERSRLERYYNEFLNAGGKTGYFDSKQVEEIAKDMETLALEAGTGSKAALMRFKRATVNMVETGNTAIENGVRLATYAAAREAGLSEAKAATLAKNLTVNFNRRGELGTALNSFYMFYNAAIQGTAQFARVMSPIRIDADGNFTLQKRMNLGQKVAAGLTAAAFGLAMLNRAGAGEDEDGENWFDKVPHYERERNLIIMKSLFGQGKPGEYWKLPLPYGYNIFYAIGDEVEAQLFSPSEERRKNVIGNLTGSLLTAFSPFGVHGGDSMLEKATFTATPTLALPAVELAANTNFFGSEIYRDDDMPGQAKKSAAASGFRGTPEMYKAVAGFLNEVSGGSEYKSGALDVSPEALEYLTDTAGGGLLRFVTRTGSAIRDEVEGVDTPVRRMPFQRKIEGEVLPFGDRERYFERRDEIRAAAAEWDNSKGLARRDSDARFNGVRRLASLTSSTDKQLKTIRTQRDKLEASTSLSPATLDARLRALEEREEAIIDRFNRSYDRFIERRTAQ